MIRVKSTELHFNNFPRKTFERGNLNNGEVASVTKYLLMRKKTGSIQSAKILFHYQLTCILNYTVPSSFVFTSSKSSVSTYLTQNPQQYILRSRYKKGRKCGHNTTKKKQVKYIRLSGRRSRSLSEIWRSKSKGRRRIKFEISFAL